MGGMLAQALLLLRPARFASFASVMSDSGRRENPFRDWAHPWVYVSMFVLQPWRAARRPSTKFRCPRRRRSTRKL